MRLRTRPSLLTYLLRGSYHGIVKEMTAILTMTPERRRAEKLGVAITAIAIMWTSSL